MPRFFLDVLHGRRVCEDPEGQDFIDLDAARAEAVASAQYLVAHGILRNEDVSDRSFLIRDEDEQTVATVPFRDSLPGTLSGGPLLGSNQLASLSTDLEWLVSDHYNEAAVAFAGRRPALGQDRWCVTWRLYQPDGTLLPHDRCPMAIALKENRPVRGVEAVAERPNGTRVSFMPFPTPLHDASGALVGGVNMLVETTHHGRAEDRIGPH
jgi:hypothetical protein